MVNYSGGNAFILAGEETTYNTPVSVTKDLGIVGSADSSLKNNLKDVRGIGDRQVQEYIAGNFEPSLKIDGTLNSGAIFEMFFGQGSDVATTSDYTHTFIDDSTSLVVQNNIKSYTIQENYDSTSDVILKYGGCKVDGVTIDVKLDEVVTISADIMAAGVDTGTTVGTKVQTSTKSFSFANCTLSTGNEGSETTVGQVQSFTADFKNNLERIGAFGSRTAEEHIPNNLEITGEFVIKFQDLTEYQRFLGGTSESSTTPTNTGLIFQATNGVTLGSGRTEFYMKGYGVQYEEVGKTTSTEGVVEATFSFNVGTLKNVYFVDAVSTYF